MASMQKLILIGHLGKDPETRYTPSGTAVCTFSLATSERWRDKSTQEQKERTTWHYCESWGRTAEICAQYLHKGAMVYIEGKIRNEEWETPQGEKKRMTKVRIDNVQFLQTNRSSEGQPAQQTAPQQYANTGQAPVTTAQSAGATATEQPKEDFDDDIPF